MIVTPSPTLTDNDLRLLRQELIKRRRSLVLVGLMGAGKTTIGRRMADWLEMDFYDADEEIESAARLSIAEIFEAFGEEEFRAGERRVIQRLLESEPCVLATGGGAFMNDETRALIQKRGISIWLRVDVEVLASRTSRRDHRPLLKGKDHHEVLGELLGKRGPVYAEANLVVDGTDEPVEVMTHRVLGAVQVHFLELSRSA